MMKSLYIFFNELRFNAGAIWHENNTIKLSIPKSYQSQEIKDYIINNRSQIISILNENFIFSKKNFLDKKIFKDNSVTHYPLSPAQERLWFIEQYEEGTNVYHIPAVFELDSKTDVDGIKYALRQIVLRHEVLRSTIEHCEEEEHGIQVVHDDPLNIEEVILSGTEDYDALIKEDINRPFNLSCDYPIRVKLYHIQSFEETSETSLNITLLLINTHHIASDGWSMVIFHRELYAYYEAYINKNTYFCLPALEIQYKNFALWQRAYLTGETLGKQLDYWKSKLQGYQTLELPTDYVRPNEIDYKGSYDRFKLDIPISQKLRTLVKRNGTTLHSVMLSSLSILLSKCTGQDDIVIGSPTANRHHQQTEGLIGFFVNTQANRFLLNSTQTYENLIQQTHQSQIEAQFHQDLPFEKLVEELGVTRDTSRHPIFQVLFSVQNFGSQSNAQAREKNYFKSYNAKNGFDTEKFDISISVNDSWEEISVFISYATSLFCQETIERLIAQYQYLIAQLLESPEKPYAQFSLLDPKEYKRIVYEWNETSRDYPKDKTVYQLFQEQTKKNPDSIALTYEQQRLTYSDLNVKSNQLAWHIRTQYQNRTGQTLTRGTLIALYLERGLEAVVGMLAVMKAGGAYVPMDTNYPQDRVDYLFGDTQVELILSQRHLTQKGRNLLPEGKVINIDLVEDIFDKENKSNLPQHSQAKDLAYVIYTSGTTGRPKGVELTHTGLTNLVFTQKDELGINSESRMLQYASLVFDASVWEIFSALLFGAELSIVPADIRQDVSLLGSYLSRHRITTTLLPPVLLSAMPYIHLPDLKIVVVGGDMCSLETMSRWSQGRKFINAYGPTEGTVISTMHTYTEGDSNANIGKPLDNTKAYVLDSNLTPVPVGIIGELYIGGAGLAHDYLGCPDLTRERFIPNLFASESDRANGYNRLYRTGDLVRWLPSGDLEFIGRNDGQVKIRGYRIELGEIEHALTLIPGVKQCCVLAKERKMESGIDKYLVAYYVLESGSDSPSQSTILDKLSQVLPEYMLPSALVSLEALPMTINGKLDKRALPDPDFNLSLDEYIAPTTEEEKQICKIWQKVLGLDRVGITDEFFRIGGDSILSIQVSSRIRQIGYNCQVKDIFEYKTIGKLAEYLMKKSAEISTKTEQGVLTGELGLLPIQQRFLDEVDSGGFVKPNHWNQSFLIRVPELDINRLKDVIKKIVSYHDVLRIHFIKEPVPQKFEVKKDIYWKQVYKSNIEFLELKTLDVSQHSDSEIRSILTDWQSGFDLEQGTLFQVGYLYGYKDASARIYFALHHIIVDAVSWRILTEDIKTLYEGKSLPPKGSSYRQWVVSVRNYTNQHPSEGLYWENQLNGMPNYHITDYQGEPNKEFLELDKELTMLLLQKTPNAYHTEINDLLLTALAYSLNEINHNSIQGITLEGHGRENIDSSIDHSRTVGWFTSMFPVKLDLQDSIKESIQSIKERLRTIPNRGIGFGSFAIDNQTRFTYKDLAPISFNYLGQFEIQEGDWQIVVENSGKNIHPSNSDHNLISINGMIRNGNLQFYIVTMLDVETTKRLRDSFKTQLTTIIKHCVAKIEGEGSSNTPSDFKSINISQSLLDRLQSEAQKYEK